MLILLAVIHQAYAGINFDRKPEGSLVIANAYDELDAQKGADISQNVLIKGGADANTAFKAFDDKVNTLLESKDIFTHNRTSVQMRTGSDVVQASDSFGQHACPNWLLQKILRLIKVEFMRLPTMLTLCLGVGYS